VHVPAAAVEEANIDLAEVVLRELTRQTLEAHQRLHLVRANSANQFVQRALAAPVAREPRSPQQLDGTHIGLLGELGANERPVRFHLGRPADAPTRARVRADQRRHRRLSFDALYAALRDAGEFGHLLWPARRST
jgi:hypothetical protein